MNSETKSATRPPRGQQASDWLLECIAQFADLRLMLRLRACSRGVRALLGPEARRDMWRRLRPDTRDLCFLSVPELAELVEVGYRLVTTCGVSEVDLLMLARGMTVSGASFLHGVFQFPTARKPYAAEVLALRAAKTGDSSLAAWHRRTLSPEPVEDVTRAFAVACNSGHLAVAQWIADAHGVTPHVSIHSAKLWACLLIEDACTHSQIEVASWLADDFFGRSVWGRGGNALAEQKRAWQWLLVALEAYRPAVARWVLSRYPATLTWLRDAAAAGPPRFVFARERVAAATIAAIPELAEVAARPGWGSNGWRIA